MFQKATWLCLLCTGVGAVAFHQAIAEESAVPGGKISEPLVAITTVDREIAIDLRYATRNNIAGRALYPPDFRARLRVSTAERLSRANQFLKRYGRRLLVWDAYRPLSVQQDLWEASGKSDYFAPPTHPEECMHTWGIAVDVTLADRWGNPQPMPTEFDVFTPSANFEYLGASATVQKNLALLRSALGRAGFLGVRGEWWHFVAEDWKDFGPIPDNPPPDFFAQPTEDNRN